MPTSAYQFQTHGGSRFDVGPNEILQIGERAHRHRTTRNHDTSHHHWDTMENHICSRCSPSSPALALRAADTDFARLDPEYQHLARFFMRERGWRKTDAVRLAKRRQATVERLYREERAANSRPRRRWDDDSMQIMTARISEAAARVQRSLGVSPVPASAVARAHIETQNQNQNQVIERDASPTATDVTRIENVQNAAQPETPHLTFSQQVEASLRRIANGNGNGNNNGNDSATAQPAPPAAASTNNVDAGVQTETEQERRERLDMELAHQLAAEFDPVEFAAMGW